MTYILDTLLICQFVFTVCIFLGFWRLFLHFSRSMTQTVQVPAGHMLICFFMFLPSSLRTTRQLVAV